MLNHTLALLRRIDEKLDREMGGLRADVRHVLDRMTASERMNSALDLTLLQKQDQLDHLRHRVEALEDHLGRPFRTPTPA